MRRHTAKHISKKKNRDQAHDSEVASGARQAEALRGGSSTLVRHQTQAEALSLTNRMARTRTGTGTSTGNTGRPQIWMYRIYM